MGSSAASQPARRGARPILGLRRQPGRLALAVFRLPLLLYRRGWGWLLGGTFLLLAHAGRKTGKAYSTTAMVLRYDPETREAVICSGWGQDVDWVRNIRFRPALRVQIGRESFTPEPRFLSEDESLAVVAEFRRQHPGRVRLISWILGWGISVRMLPHGALSARGRSSLCVRRIPRLIRPIMSALVIELQVPGLHAYGSLMPPRFHW